MAKRICDERACVLNTDYTLSLQSEDPPTLFATLRKLLEDRPNLTAHLYADRGFWGAWLSLEAPGEADAVETWVPGVTEESRHWVRLLVEDERRHVILRDRTFHPVHPGGDVTEPQKGW